MHEIVLTNNSLVFLAMLILWLVLLLISLIMFWEIDKKYLLKASGELL